MSYKWIANENDFALLTEWSWYNAGVPLLFVDNRIEPHRVTFSLRPNLFTTKRIDVALFLNNQQLYNSQTQTNLNLKFINFQTSRFS